MWLVVQNEIWMAASSLLSGSHGRKRRHERRIEKIDRKWARRYGIVEPARYGRLKYTYGGITFIYDPRERKGLASTISSNSSRTSRVAFEKARVHDTS